MGADFIYATLPVFDLTEGRIKKLLELVQEQRIECEKGDEQDVIELRDRVYEYVRLLPETVDSREVSKFWLPGMNYQVWLTGGMSGGEPPTEASDAFCEIENFPLVFRAIAQWAKEDFKKGKLGKPSAESTNCVILRL